MYNEIILFIRAMCRLVSSDVNIQNTYISNCAKLSAPFRCSGNFIPFVIRHRCAYFKPPLRMHFGLKITPANASCTWLIPRLHLRIILYAYSDILHESMWASTCELLRPFSKCRICYFWRACLVRILLVFIKSRVII